MKEKFYATNICYDIDVEDVYEYVDELTAHNAAEKLCVSELAYSNMTTEERHDYIYDLVANHDDIAQEILGLPNSILLPAELAEMEDSEGYVSDKTGFCHTGFDICAMKIDDEYAGNKFFVSLEKGTVTWIQRYLDTKSKDSVYVLCCFEEALLDKAINKCPTSPEKGFEAYSVFDYIEAHGDVKVCNALSSDKHAVSNIFECAAEAVGLSHTTIDTLKLYFKARKQILACSRDVKLCNPRRIELTTISTNSKKLAIKVVANLVDLRTEYLHDETVVAYRAYDSLSEYVEYGLAGPFQDLLDEVIEIAEHPLHHNVLVIKELYDDEMDQVIELPDNDEEVAKIAKIIFEKDVEVEKFESGVDENNTFWEE